MATRRSNKSHRVPNVKLRPYNPQLSRRRTPPSSVTPSSSPPAHDDFPASFYDPCPRPFKGVLLCATGVDKSTIFGKAGEMGANTTSDFTDRVTHLIAEQHGGAKYQCAVQRKIPIMKPSWILESFDIWQRGDDIDFAESVEHHRLPIFSGVILSLSGFDDIPHRTEINRLVTQQQGTYVKNIERPVRVTHLLCTGDVETDKMKYSRKFNERGEANIKLVWEEWFWDSLEFGGRFDESSYKVEHPRPERKTFTQPPPPAATDPKAVAEAASAANEPEEEEIAPARRLPAVTLQVWESLLRPRGYVRVGGELVRVNEGPSQLDEPSQVPPVAAPVASASKPKPKAKPKPSQHPAVDQEPERKAHSALSTFDRTKSFAPPRMEAESSKQPFRRSASLFGSARASPAPGAVHETIPALTGIFSGLTFRARGEAKSASVRDAILAGGGRWIDGAVEEEDSVDIIIVRLVSGSILFRAEVDETERAKYRTECWLEGCLARERVCAPDEHASFVPLSMQLPLPGGDKVIISPSGLDMAEDMWIKRLTRALGISHAPNFSRATTHLLCPSGKGAKFDKAQEWGTPVVNLGWLEQMIATSAVPPVSDYLVLYPAGQGAERKGKQKAVALEDSGFMADITNDPRPAPPVAHAVPMPERTPSPQKQSLTRAPTMVVDIPPDPEPMFGRPASLLNNARPPSPPHSSPPIDHPPPVPESPSAPLSLNPNPPPLVRVPTLPVAPAADDSDTEPEDEEPPKVPSSSTPSPLKMPGASSTGNSPVRPGVSDAAARALHESLSTVLGKRMSGNEDAPSAARGRPGKRPRPRPKNTTSRQGSGSGNNGENGMHEAGLLPIPEAYDTSYAYSEEMGGPRAASAGMEGHARVTYEDPAQSEERRRLMKLFEGAKTGDNAGVVGGDAMDSGGAGAGQGKTRTAAGVAMRRSSRMAGF
ncbi:hypothetical protein OF83DRAFT_929396 [Amylostereum chailletii]|nr:hypothetical protein OF83DRAFT_929396 [Amylostereum chailletii]